MAIYYVVFMLAISMIFYSIKKPSVIDILLYWTCLVSMIILWQTSLGQPRNLIKITDGKVLAFYLEPPQKVLLLVIPKNGSEATYESVPWSNAMAQAIQQYKNRNIDGSLFIEHGQLVVHSDSVTKEG